MARGPILQGRPRNAPDGPEAATHRPRAAANRFGPKRMRCADERSVGKRSQAARAERGASSPALLALAPASQRKAENGGRQRRRYPSDTCPGWCAPRSLLEHEPVGPRAGGVAIRASGEFGFAADDTEVVEDTLPLIIFLLDRGFVLLLRLLLLGIFPLVSKSLRSLMLIVLLSAVCGLDATGES